MDHRVKPGGDEEYDFPSRPRAQRVVARGQAWWDF